MSLTVPRAPRTIRWAGLAAVPTALALLVAPVAAAEPPEPGTGEGDPVVETVVAESPPTVVGEPQVGQVLTASAPTWVPAEATTTFQWLRDGELIAGATGDRYTLVAADLNGTIAVQATGTREGYADGAATSAATGPVSPGP